MRNPLIILCPLRSFSSLVCGILGQHPEMIGMPELNLFQGERLGPLRDQLLRTRPHATHGLLRALAELQFGGQDEANVERAKAWIDERRGWSTKQVFDHMIDLSAPRIVIDKSPATVMTGEFLDRAYRYYPNALFLHLTRHPRGTCRSIIELVKHNDEWDGPADPERIDPERIWMHTHRNIVDFCDRLPEGQCMRIKGEELVSDLDLYLPQICEWLGVSTEPQAIAAMKHPERSPFACLGPENAKYGGDPNFLGSPALRPGRITEPVLAGEFEWAPGRTFSRETVKLAKQFGYR